MAHSLNRLWQAARGAAWGLGLDLLRAVLQEVVLNERCRRLAQRNERENRLIAEMQRIRTYKGDSEREKA